MEHTYCTNVTTRLRPSDCNASQRQVCYGDGEARESVATPLNQRWWRRTPTLRRMNPAWGGKHCLLRWCNGKLWSIKKWEKQNVQVHTTFLSKRIGYNRIKICMFRFIGSKKKYLYLNQETLILFNKSIIQNRTA